MIRPLVATLLSATFAFQVLAADTVACTGSAEAAAMPGMNTASEGSAADHTAHQLPCDEPVTAPTCLMMALCAASSAVASAATLQPDVGVSPRVAPMRALEPTSRTDPPESPPPRA
jgi:hypothetical protein